MSDETTSTEVETTDLDSEISFKYAYISGQGQAGNAIGGWKFKLLMSGPVLPPSGAIVSGKIVLSNGSTGHTIQADIHGELTELLVPPFLTFQGKGSDRPPTGKPMGLAEVRGVFSLGQQPRGYIIVNGHRYPASGKFVVKEGNY